MSFPKVHEANETSASYPFADIPIMAKLVVAITALRSKVRYCFMTKTIRLAASSILKAALRALKSCWSLVEEDALRSANCKPRSTDCRSTHQLAASTTDQERYGFQIKTAQIRETINLAAYSATTHVVVAAAIYWFWHGKPRAFLVPFCFIILLTESVVFAGKILFERIEPTRRVVDLACRWAEAIAFVQGLTWGSMPIALIGGIDSDHRVFAVAIVAGLIGGVFVFGSISRITIIYMLPLVGGTFAGLMVEHQPISYLLAVLLTIYALFVLTSVLRLNSLAMRRILNQLRVDDQRETIGLLLNDFEESTSDWLWETDTLGRLIHVSDRMAQAAQVAPSVLLNSAFDEMFDRDVIGTSMAAGAQQLKATMAAHNAFRDLIVTLTRGGMQYSWALAGKPLFSGSGALIGFRGVGSDITTAIQAQEQIAYLAKHDALTGLSNRAMFIDLLRQAPKADNASSIAVLSVDLDDFKIVNDTFGHAIGDEVLRCTADRLRASVPADAIVARLGGDEFAVFLRAASEGDAIGLAGTLINRLGEPCQCEGLAVTIGATIGLAEGAIDTFCPEAMLHNADLALYEAKSRGKGTFVCFESTLESAIGARLALQGDLKEAITRDEMMVHYQPIISGRSRKIIGFEALLRWRCPRRGNVSPAEFIAAAESCGAIVPIGAWTLKQACLQASHWPEDIRIAVNLSPLQCRSSNLIDMVKDALAVSGLAPRRLELEITESVLLATTATVKKNIAELKNIGVRLALDDFGTGFSSLSYLLKFRVDKIKIDQCFIKELPMRLESGAVVDAIIGLAQRLGVTVTAEGVETTAQVSYLTAHSCDELQGFLFSPALPTSELDSLFARRFSDDQEPIPRDTNRPVRLSAEDLFGGCDVMANKDPLSEMDKESVHHIKAGGERGQHQQIA